MDDARQCHAQSKQTGNRCKNASIPGGQVCRFHGGRAGQVVRAAQRRLAEAEAIRVLGHEVEVVPVTDPIGALSHLAGEVLGLRGVVREMLTEVEGDRDDDRPGLDRVTTLVGLYNGVVDRAERLLTTLAKLDPDNREMTIDNRQMRAVVMAVMMTVESLGVRASEQQVNALMAQNLRAARVEIGGL